MTAAVDAVDLVAPALVPHLERLLATAQRMSERELAELGLDRDLMIADLVVLIAEALVPSRVPSPYLTIDLARGRWFDVYAGRWLDLDTGEVAP